MRKRFRCERCGMSWEDRWDHHCFDGEVDLVPFESIGPEDIPDGERGTVSIDRVTLERDTNVAGNWHHPSFMSAGESIVRLKRNGRLWMSNTPDEVHSQRFPITHSRTERPSILLGGLGLGIAIQIINEKCIPEKVVVVEIDPDVIALVSQVYEPLPWLEIVEGDIREYGKIGPRDFFDVAWIDIWQDYSTDDLEDMFAIRRSLRRVMKPGRGFCGKSRVMIWKEDELKEARR